MRSYYLHDDPELGDAFGPYFTHEYLVYFSVIGIDEIMALEKVNVQSNPNFGNYQEGPNHIDIYKEIHQLKRIIHSDEASDPCIRNSDFSTEVPQDITIEPWKILVLYTTEPDMHLDCDLDLHPSQKLTKGSHGYRHMQFKILGKKFGITDQCSQYFYDSAIKAYKMGNHYWAFRFLARSIHYLADLGHPFHVKIAPPLELMKILTDKKRAFKIFAAAHNGHEVYTQKRFRDGFLPFKNALIRGSQQGFQSTENIRKRLKKYRKNAEKSINTLYKLLVFGFGDTLIDAYNIVDKYKDVDSSKSTAMAEKEACAVIFADPNNPILKELDQITENLLENVGYMYGLIFREFLDLIK